jgi:hypothetical protein
MSESDTDEGMDFANIFVDRFKSRERTTARLKAEHVAAMTPKQRARRKPPKIQINFRASAETKATIDALAERLSLTVTDVVALAVSELAKSRLEGAK